MPMPAPRHSVVAPFVLVIAMLVGCGGGGGGGARAGSSPAASPRPVTAEAFASVEAPPASASASSSGVDAKPFEPAAAAVAEPGATEPGSARASLPVAPDRATGAGMKTAAVAGSPTPAPDARPSGTEPAIVESLIGQINGRPVFASEILEPLNDQLRAEATKAKERREFRQVAGRLIAESVWRLVKDELILAEARASLSPEQKQGLFFLLSKLQEDVVSQQRGSAVAADEALRSGSGQSLQQAAKDRLNRELILNELRQRVAPRVIVTPRQIAQEYERNFDKYNPRPVAVYRLVVMDLSNAAAVERVRDELAAGRSFDEIADSDVNLLAKAKGGGRVEIELKNDPEQALFANRAVSDAARGLAVGQIAGPIIAGGSAQWVRLESVRQEPAVPLYDAQLQIEADLRERRFQAETERYFDRLRKRGSVSNIEDMVVRLLFIAEQRYLGAAAQ